MKKTKHLLAEREPGESAVLEQIEGVAATTLNRRSGVRLALGDDAGIFQAKRGYEQVLTCDWFLEGTHFLRYRHPPDAVGWKCLARAVSDIAAMGAVPRCFLLSLALPATHVGSWLSEFLGGLRRAAKRYQCGLIGGDTTQRKDILISVTVVGEVRQGRAVLRTGAGPGETLYASGRLGEADLGLRLIRDGKGPVNRRDPRLRKHLYPEPRLTLGRWLAENRLASAMMDLSDGLSTDLPRLCAANGLGARIEAATIAAVRLPDSELRRNDDSLDLALHGGDDYELLFTVARKNLKRIPRSFHGLPLTAIGEMTTEQAVVLIATDGREAPLPNRGWDPFRT